MLFGLQHLYCMTLLPILRLTLVVAVSIIGNHQELVTLLNSPLQFFFSSLWLLPNSQLRISFLSGFFSLFNP